MAIPTPTPAGSPAEPEPLRSPISSPRRPPLRRRSSCGQYVGGDGGRERTNRRSPVAGYQPRAPAGRQICIQGGLEAGGALLKGAARTKAVAARSLSRGPLRPSCSCCSETPEGDFRHLLLFPCVPSPSISSVLREGAGTASRLLPEMDSIQEWPAGASNSARPKLGFRLCLRPYFSLVHPGQNLGVISFFPSTPPQPIFHLVWWTLGPKSFFCHPLSSNPDSAPSEP